MKNIPLPVFFILLLFAFLIWWLNRCLQQLIKPRASLPGFLLYLLSGFTMAFVAVFVATRLILWLFPPTLK